MSGCGAGVCVIVVAVRKVSAVIEEKTKATFAQLIVVAIQVIAAKLVDHNDYDKFRVSIVGRSETKAYRA